MDTLSPDFVLAGTIVAFAGDDTSSLKSTWHLCDGKELFCDQWPELFQAIRYSNGGTENTFSLPDLRGMFIRGK